MGCTCRGWTLLLSACDPYPALVAAYQALRPRLGREDAIAAIQAAFTEPLGPAVRAGTRAMLDGAPDPFRAMVEVCKSRERDSFGAAFAFRRPVDDDQRYHLDVRRCFYHDVLAACGAAELTPVMCAFDKAWIEAIDPDEHGFRFDRFTTIGYGGSHCPFHFTRTRPGPAACGWHHGRRSRGRLTRAGRRPGSARSQPAGSGCPAWTRWFSSATTGAERWGWTGWRGGRGGCGASR